HLDEASFAEKVAVAYEYMEVREFVDEMLDAYGSESFQTECFFPVCRESLVHLNAEGKPKYELLGEELVTKGVYRDVIRYEEHVRPLIESFRSSLLNVA
ncbi:MAG: hypothetical protein ACI9G1_001133, partial [Pirellulaceae bacterium]